MAFDARGFAAELESLGLSRGVARAVTNDLLGLIDDYGDDLVLRAESTDAATDVTPASRAMIVDGPAGPLSIINRAPAPVVHAPRWPGSGVAMCGAPLGRYRSDTPTCAACLAL